MTGPAATTPDRSPCRGEQHGDTAHGDTAHGDAGPGHDHASPGHDHTGPGHGHDHAGPLARIRHALGSPGHDLEDAVDDELEGAVEGRRAVVGSLWLLLATAVAQGVVAVLSGSVALLGDTLHNVTDALTAVPLLIAFALARRPPSDRLTYGYGRAEDLAGIAVVAMMLLSAALAAYESVHRLLDPRPVQHLLAVALAGVVGVVGNEVVARYRIRVGRRIGSAALVADGLHARTDGVTSLAVVLGTGGVALGWAWADPVVGILITVAILGMARSALRQVGERLMDAVDPELVMRVRDALRSVPGVTAVEDVRVRWVGHGLWVEASVRAPAGISLREADTLTEATGAALRDRVRRLSAVTIRARPDRQHQGQPARVTGAR